MISCLVLSDLVHSDQFLEKNCSIRNSQNRIDKTLPHVVNPQTQKMFRILTEQKHIPCPSTRDPSKWQTQLPVSPQPLYGEQEHGKHRHTEVPVGKPVAGNRMCLQHREPYKGINGQQNQCRRTAV